MSGIIYLCICNGDVQYTSSTHIVLDMKNTVVSVLGSQHYCHMLMYLNNNINY